MIYGSEGEGERGNKNEGVYFSLWRRESEERGCTVSRDLSAEPRGRTKTAGLRPAALFRRILFK